MSSIDVVLDEESSLEDAPSAGGGPPRPPGGGAGAPASPAGTVGEGGLEDALQFGGLIAGQLAA